MEWTRKSQVNSSSIIGFKHYHIYYFFFITKIKYLVISNTVICKFRGKYNLTVKYYLLYLPYTSQMAWESVRSCLLEQIKQTNLTGPVSCSHRK